MFGRNRIIKSHLRQRFIVTLKTGDAFDGVIMDADGSMLILGAASLYTSNSEKVAADGQIFLARADIEFMQLAGSPVLIDGTVAR